MSGNIIHGSSKTYNHSVGLSCCFRQWRATSHCNKLHGYALKVRLDFECVRLDDKNWVVDFGGLKDFKAELENAFDHKTIVAIDDPHIEWYREGQRLGTMEIIEMPVVGCEGFSSLIFQNAQHWLVSHNYWPRVQLKQVEVSEHSGNSGWTRRAD